MQRAKGCKAGEFHAFAFREWTTRPCGDYEHREPAKNYRQGELESANDLMWRRVETLDGRLEAARSRGNAWRKAARRLEKRLAVWVLGTGILVATLAVLCVWGWI